MPSLCAQLKKDYQAIKALKAEFDLAYEKARKTGNLQEAKRLKAQLEQKREALREKLWPFEFLNQKELKEQYNNQKEILQIGSFFPVLAAVPYASWRRGFRRAYLGRRSPGTRDSFIGVRPGVMVL